MTSKWQDGDKVIVIYFSRNCVQKVKMPDTNLYTVLFIVLLYCLFITQSYRGANVTSSAWNSLNLSTQNGNLHAKYEWMQFCSMSKKWGEEKTRNTFYMKYVCWPRCSICNYNPKAKITTLHYVLVLLLSDTMQIPIIYCMSGFCIS